METRCDRVTVEKNIKATVKTLEEFNKNFTNFLEQQKKEAKLLTALLTRYIILDSGPPCSYLIVQKEEFMQELLLKVQDATSSIGKALNSMKQQLSELQSQRRSVELSVLAADWTSLSESGNCVYHQSPSESLEDVRDACFRYDILITCIEQYFDALDLRNIKTYEHLANSLEMPLENVALLQEFLIKNAQTM